MSLLTKKKPLAKWHFLLRQESFKRVSIVSDDYFHAKEQALRAFQSEESDWKGEIFTELEKIEQNEK